MLGERKQPGGERYVCIHAITLCMLVIQQRICVLYGYIVYN